MAKKSSKVQPEALPFTMRNIYFRNTQTKLAEKFDPLIPNQQLSPIMRNSGGRVESKVLTVTDPDGNEETIRSCAFTSGFEFAYVLFNGNAATLAEEEQQESFLAQISAEITVEYIISTPDFPDQNMLNKWASSNVILHAWPYWREFCQAAMQRMSLPVITLPLMAISAPPAP